jgi:hypothetical protein
MHVSQAHCLHVPVFAVRAALASAAARATRLHVYPAERLAAPRLYDSQRQQRQRADSLTAANAQQRALQLVAHGQRVARRQRRGQLQAGGFQVLQRRDDEGGQHLEDDGMER